MSEPSKAERPRFSVIPCVYHTDKFWLSADGKIKRHTFRSNWCVGKERADKLAEQLNHAEKSGAPASAAPSAPACEHEFEEMCVFCVKSIHQVIKETESTESGGARGLTPNG